MSYVQLPARALVALLLGTLLSTGCMGPSGSTVQEKRASALEMRARALEVLYEDDPSLKAKVERSAGYAVYSCFSVHPGLFSFATGYGVLTNHATDELTHARWTRLTLGPGIAVKGLYGLVLVNDADTVQKFEEGPWVAGGQVEASFVFGDFGGCLEQAWAYGRDVEVHYVTHTGVALELEFIGFGKVSNSSELNDPAVP